MQDNESIKHPHRTTNTLHINIKHGLILSLRDSVVSIDGVRSE